MYKPKISIITPNYNYSHFISTLIESVLCQDYPFFEHIIVDDGSTDNSVEVIERFAKKDQRIKLIKQRNQGQTTAINTGLQILTGNIIGWINSDDFYEKNVFGKIIKAFNENSNYKVIFGDSKVVNEKKKTVRIHKSLPLNFNSACFLGFGSTIYSNSIFWRREVFKEVGFLNEKLKYNMDDEYLSRIAEKFNFKKVNFVISNFRVHQNAKTFIQSGIEERNKEYDFGFKTNYSKTWQSKIFNYKIGKYFKFWYKLKRIFLRLIHGHYFYYLLFTNYQGLK
jgi:glycosyltransferase involved in cell wall biosynthesis